MAFVLLGIAMDALSFEHCQVCDVETLPEFLVRVEVWPADRACPGCVAELMADDLDPRETEPEL